MSSTVKTKNFQEDKKRLLLEGGISKEDQFNSDTFNIDIAQSRYFTVTLNNPDGSSIFPHLKIPKSIRESNNNVTGFDDNYFLPVKSINVQDTSFDSLSIPVATFSDVPLMNKKRTCVIQLTCYDIDNDVIERALRRWKNSCFVGNRVVYLSDIYKDFTYKSYNVSGKLNYSVLYYVVLTGAISVSRDYEGNGEKLVTFSLATVGEAETNSKI